MSAVRYNISKKTRFMTQLAILSAIVIIMAFTPLGYLKIGFVAISFLALPVSLGAILLGPAAGAVLGFIFGATSFIQCFGLDPFGVMLMSINPVFTFIMCVLSRTLMGWFVGLIFKALRGKRTVDAFTPRLNPSEARELFSHMAANVSGALLNTAFFVGLLLLFFGGDKTVQGALGVSRVIDILPVLLTVNALIEAAVCLVAGTAISMLLSHALRGLNPEA